MKTNGRLETRTFLTLPLLLFGALDSPAELALTENVSVRGARVVAKRAGKAGERLKLTDLSGDFRAAARVVYCENLPNRNYCIGLELEGSQKDWWKGLRPMHSAAGSINSRSELDSAN